MKKLVLLAILFALPLLACSFNIDRFETKTVNGSGVIASETRPLSGFDEIELRGSANVFVSFGEVESVIVEADDNILPLVVTEVRRGKLVINLKPNTTITTKEPIHVAITMKALKGVTLPGSGNITIAGLEAKTIDLNLSGSGNITADGEADTVNVSMGGSGNIICSDLQARSAQVRLTGSGNISVFAEDALDVNLRGSGSVTYRGEPQHINTSIPGSGSVQAVP
jgi:hypothetical protein